MEPLQSGGQPIKQASGQVQEILLNHLKMVDKESVAKAVEAWGQKETQENTKLWNSIIKREFPEATIDPTTANPMLYLKLLNRTLFGYVMPKDPLNLQHSGEDSMDLDDQDPLLTYTKLNQWLVEIYSKRTLAQIFAQTPGKLELEHRQALIQLLREKAKDHETGVIIAHKPKENIGDARGQVDELGGMTSQQLELVASVISEQEEPVRLSLINVELSDDQLPAICRLVEKGKISFLDLTENNISDKGAQKLGQCLGSEACKTTLVVLDKNKITDEGTKKILSLLSESRWITLRIRHNLLSHDQKRRLRQYQEEQFSSVLVEVE